MKLPEFRKHIAPVRRPRTKKEHLTPRERRLLVEMARTIGPAKAAYVMAVSPDIATRWRKEDDAQHHYNERFIAP